MIHLKYKCKVNFVKLPLIWIYRRLKLVFENDTAGSNTGYRSVVNRASSFSSVSYDVSGIHSEYMTHQLLDAVHKRACTGIKKRP